MSDNWIAIIPLDMSSEITDDQLAQAAEYFQAIAPDLEEIHIIHQNKLRFFSCGQNLESIQCPCCEAPISRDWWIERAEAGYEYEGDVLQNGEESFKLVPVNLPCCGAVSDLSKLHYSWDQGFSYWGIDAMNPDIGRLNPQHVRQFESILGCPVKVIYECV